MAWVSSSGSDFNFDLGYSRTEEQTREAIAPMLEAGPPPIIDHNDRVGVEQERHHHLRLERRPTPAILPIRSVESAQVELVDRVQHKPNEMILRQPLPQARRQQQHLLTVTRKKFWGTVDLP